MPTCSSRRSPRPFTAGIPPILGTEPGVSSASAGTGGGQWAGARGEEVEGGAGRTEGSWLENPRALQGPRDWTLRGGPSTWGPVLAGGRAALPASSQVPSWGPEAAVVRARAHTRTCTHGKARTRRTHSHAHVRSAHTCVHARTQGHSQCTPAHTCVHTCTHTTHMRTRTPKQSLEGPGVQPGKSVASRGPRPAGARARGPGEATRGSSGPTGATTQTRQAQALRTALHAPPSSPARPAIPCQALRRPYKRRVSLRSGPAARGLCTCPDAPPRLRCSPAPGSPSVLGSGQPSAAAGPESSLGPTPSGLCTQIAPSTQPLSYCFASWRWGATLSRCPRGQNRATEVESPAGPWCGQRMVTRGSGTCLGTRLVVTTRGAPGIDCMGPGMLLNTPQHPGRPPRRMTQPVTVSPSPQGRTRLGG